jgi:TRAP-type mannitol/chloroaromatic compound transport system substrate-binding protein
MGLFLAAGPLLAALTGEGADAADFVGTLTGMGISELEARLYQGRIKEGGSLLSIHVENSEWAMLAKGI